MIGLAPILQQISPRRRHRFQTLRGALAAIRRHHRGGRNRRQRSGNHAHVRPRQRDGDARLHPDVEGVLGPKSARGGAVEIRLRAGGANFSCGVWLRPVLASKSFNPLLLRGLRRTGVIGTGPFPRPCYIQPHLAKLDRNTKDKTRASGSASTRGFNFL